MIHKTAIVVIIITCIIAFIMIVTFRINIFQISVIQILSLIITVVSCSVVVSLLTHLFDLPKNPILEFDGVIKVRDDGSPWLKVKVMLKNAWVGILSLTITTKLLQSGDMLRRRVLSPNMCPGIAAFLAYTR
jgi:hypothetical protein